MTQPAEPGTGKSTRAAKDISAAVDKHGNDRVVVATFTKAAAVEIESRAVPIKSDMIGTLHSICYHALRCPKLAETKIKDFNEAEPIFALSGSQAHLDEMHDIVDGQTTGDALLAQYQLLRARMTPRMLWPVSVSAFAERWERWKREAEVLDFTDLLETVYMRRAAAPGLPKAIFIDETQDLNALQFALVRTWANNAETIVMYGDIDQTIFAWSGADPSHMIDRVPKENQRVLKQSYRVPSRIHTKAVEWIKSCKQRADYDYLPRDYEGEIEQLRGANYRNPEALVDAVERDLAELKPDHRPTAMVLASCAYMLKDTITVMRERGIPFYNPYRRTRGDWNPLSNAEGSTINRLRAFMTVTDTMFPEWKAKDMALWTGLIKSDALLKRGAKKSIDAIAEAEPGRLLTAQDYMGWFVGDPFGWEPIKPSWLFKYALESKKKALEYPLRVAEKYGTDARPKVCIGTGHSVKGGESRRVYLCPDVSQQGYAEWRGPGSDNVRRLFYVGMTRASERLTVLSPAGPLAVPI